MSLFNFVTFLQKLPESVTPRAVSRLASGVEQRLIDSRRRPAANPINMWQLALVAALRRWDELSCPPSVSVGDIVALTVRVLESLGTGEFEDVVEWLAGYVSKSSDNKESVSEALLSVSRGAPNETEALLSRLSGRLEASARTEFWLLLLSKGLMKTDIPPVGQWMRNIDPEDKPHIFSSLFKIVQNESSVAAVKVLLAAE